MSLDARDSSGPDKMGEKVSQRPHVSCNAGSYGTRVFQDLLCGPSDVPSSENDRLQAASQRATQSFYDMVDNILSCKEHDERIAEAERRANALAAAPID
ncbi:hypothetical protein QTP88_014859 [Uroleucon formosanum]